MTCIADDVEQRLLLEDINATDQDTRRFLRGLRGLSCARALRGLLNGGYKIEPGGGGALAGGGADLVPHQIYTLTQTVKGDNDDDD